MNFMSSDLRPHVLDTRVKGEAELSTDHYLVVSWLRWWGRMLVRSENYCERLLGTPVKISIISKGNTLNTASIWPTRLSVREQGPGTFMDSKNQWCGQCTSPPRGSSRFIGLRSHPHLWSRAMVVTKIKRSWVQAAELSFPDPGHTRGTQLAWERLGNWLEVEQVFPSDPLTISQKKIPGLAFGLTTILHVWNQNCRT